MKRLYRSKSKVIGGVCGGVGNYLDIDPVVVRLIAAMGLIFTCFTAAVAYFIAWIIIPEESVETQSPDSEN